MMPNTRETHDPADPFNLRRFISAQEPVYSAVLDELGRGQKRTHWMWFIFPQVDGLGFSATSRFYAIKTKAEAQQYLQHPILRERLLKCAEILLSIQGKSALAIFGSPDDMKLQSSMTLFAAVSEPGSVFERVLNQYFQGQRDTKTLALLEQQQTP
jgi:uncharacterized protein (DUF1810 family)